MADVLSGLLGAEVPVAFRAYDGSHFGPSDASTTVVISSPDALRRIIASPDELGFGRAFVAGELDVDGNVFDALALAEQFEALHVRPTTMWSGLKLLGPRSLKPLAPPPEEARLRGRRHSRERDAQAIAHHYDISSEFYRIVLGPSLTYSCAVWTDHTPTL